MPAERVKYMIRHKLSKNNGFWVNGFSGLQPGWRQLGLKRFRERDRALDRIDPVVRFDFGVASPEPEKLACAQPLWNPLAHQAPRLVAEALSVEAPQQGMSVVDLHDRLGARKTRLAVLATEPQVIWLECPEDLQQFAPA